MQQRDTNIYEAWIKGMSIGAIAKNYKLDKSQIKKVINRVGSERRVNDPTVLLKLSNDKTS